MKHTAKQTNLRTLEDLHKALARKRPVTIHALKEEKDERGRKTGNLVPTLRTLEIYDLTTTADGNILIHGMDRETGEDRNFRLDRLLAYTVHRTTYTVERPAPEADTERPDFAEEADFIAWEIARTDAEYWTEYLDEAHPVQALAA
ncbi:WYL domain-containing protein [Streptomyces sp. t99]|uniref:WYL domain-containing protein n=1 Tax=Streptomyces sp. t99 TaxID=1828172 RepID=UPI000BFBA688|nr:WYL domain-containing protein [Streptomyces sp. t99]